MEKAASVLVCHRCAQAVDECDCTYAAGSHLSSYSPLITPLSSHLSAHTSLFTPLSSHLSSHLPLHTSLHTVRHPQVDDQARTWRVRGAGPGGGGGGYGGGAPAIGGGGASSWRPTQIPLTMTASPRFHFRPFETLWAPFGPYRAL